MKKTQLATWLQNKMVLAALLMVLVAGTVVAGVVALRNGDAGEQQETEPGYAFQTQEDDQVRDQQLNQQGDIQPAGDPTQGWVDIQPESLQDPNALLQRPDKEADKEIDPKDTYKEQEGRPVQSGQVDAITGSQDGVNEYVAGIDDGQAEAEPLVDSEGAVVYEPENEAEAVIAPGAPLDFQAGSTMGWPVFGNVLLDYSMDTTIYFPTLEQYKCNPGILIQAEVGQPVEAAVRGQVTVIGSNEELGDFIMMDLGGDYSICYGQLDEIQVSIGQIVEAGDVLGAVAQPTKYYVVEGPNLYLEMRYRQEPVDPLDYIR